MSKNVSILFIIIVSFFSTIKAKAQAPDDTLLLGLGGKAGTFGDMGKLDSALLYAKKAQSYAENKYGELSLRNAGAYSLLGFCYYSMHDFRSAYNAYKKSIDIYEAPNVVDEPHIYWYGQALLFMGATCNTVSAYSEAEDALKKSAPILKKVGQWGDYADCLANLAITYVYFGAYSKAKLLYDTVKQVIDTIPKNTDTYYTETSRYSNLANIYSQTGNPRKAFEYLKKAESVFSLTKNQRDYGEIYDYGGLYFSDYIQLLINVADTYRNMHYNDSAMLKCDEAEHILKNKRYDGSYANILQEKAKIYMAENEFAKAKQLCKKSLQIADTLPERPDFYDAAVVSLGALCQHAQQYASADSIYRKEIYYLYGKGLTTSYNLQRTLMVLCKNLLYQNKNKEAADSLVVAANLALHVLNENFAGMSENDQLQYTAAFDGIFGMLNSLLEKDKNIGGNVKQLAFVLQLQRKNIVLINQVSLLNRLRATSDTALTNLYAAWLNTRQMLAKQNSLPFGERNLNIDSLQDISESLEKQVSAKGFTAGFKTNMNIADKFIQQDKSTANIEFVRYNHIAKNAGNSNAIYGACMLKGGDSTPVFVRLCSEAALLHLMKNENGQPIDEEQLAQKFYDPVNSGASSLYALIWQPLEKYLHGAIVINY